MKRSIHTRNTIMIVVFVLLVCDLVGHICLILKNNNDDHWSDAIQNGRSIRLRDCAPNFYSMPVFCDKAFYNLNRDDSVSANPATDGLRVQIFDSLSDLFLGSHDLYLFRLLERAAFMPLTICLQL